MHATMMVVYRMIILSERGYPPKRQDDLIIVILDQRVYHPGSERYHPKTQDDLELSSYACITCLHRGI